jgi:CRISPR-associated protein (TIGR03984 family)
MNYDLCQEISTKKISESVENWLKQQVMTKDYQFPYLLAHADDGVIWGRFDVKTGNLFTAKQAFPECNFPLLRLLTLQQCRLFGEAGEIMLWNSDGQWHARLILQIQALQLLQSKQIGVITEEQILWGTQGKRNGNFTLLSDGFQGLKHAVPIAVEESYFSTNKKELYRPVRLELHHYFSHDKDGIARIFLSRLVSLKKEAKK